MGDASAAAFLRALQVADGTLPIGRFAHSYGVESWHAANPDAGPDAFFELVRSTLMGSVATLDGAGVALSHAAAAEGDLMQLRQIDAALTARKLSASARRASTLCGGRLAELAAEMDVESEVVSHVAREVGRGSWDGNLSVVEGAVGAGMGIPGELTVLIAVRGHAAAMLSAAVRLGRLGTNRSQALMYALNADIEDCAQVARDLSLDGLWSTLPELEIHAARHEYREARMFMT